MTKVAAVIPAYNEAANIGKVCNVSSAARS